MQRIKQDLKNIHNKHPKKNLSTYCPRQCVSPQSVCNPLSTRCVLPIGIRGKAILEEFRMSATLGKQPSIAIRRKTSNNNKGAACKKTSNTKSRKRSNARRKASTAQKNAIPQSAGQLLSFVTVGQIKKWLRDKKRSKQSLMLRNPNEYMISPYRSNTNRPSERTTRMVGYQIITKGSAPPRIRGHMYNNYKTCNACHTINSKFRARVEVRQRACMSTRMAAETRDGYLTRLYGSLRARCPASLDAPEFWDNVAAFRSWIAQETTRCTPIERCGWCGIELLFSSIDAKGLDRQITLDRRHTARDTSLGLSGSQEYTPANVVIACRFCQLARNDASIAHWKDYRRILFASRTAPTAQSICSNSTTITPGAHLHKTQAHYAELPDGWALKQFLTQSQCSLLTPGMPLHCCTGRNQCLFAVSVDRIDNSKGHTVDNVWLSTRGEQYSKRTVRGGEPMTVDRWQRCREARIDSMNTLL